MPVDPERSGRRVGQAEAPVIGLGRAPFLLDIRAASGKPAGWLSRERSMSVNYTTENLIVPQRAFDALLYFDRLTPSRKLP